MTNKERPVRAYFFLIANIFKKKLAYVQISRHGFLWFKDLAAKTQLQKAPTAGARGVAPRSGGNFYLI